MSAALSFSFVGSYAYLRQPGLKCGLSLMLGTQKKPRLLFSGGGLLPNGGRLYAAIFSPLTLCRVSCKVRNGECTFEVIDLLEEPS